MKNSIVLKELLCQLCDLQKEIKELEIKIEKLENKKRLVLADSVQSSSQYFPFSKGSFKIEGIDIKADLKIDRYTNILKKRYDELLIKQTQAEEFISNIPISRLRRIFVYRYIEQLSWIKIAYKIGGNSTADSIRMEHDRFIK